ncbi:MAG: SDR family oxidoreductase, partial [Anaerolineae bacterium]|nr:SDR family oxidoreductase [Anaerolineae bacterium]
MTQTGMKDKLVLITGANSGIGKETARGLAAMGATIIMACRNLEKAAPVRDAIAEETGNAGVSIMHIDLASLESIHTFAREFVGAYTRLDVLINNAGTFSSTRQETEDGFEKTMGTNHLGPFLLTHLMLPFLRQAVAARIVNVSSGAAFFGKIHLDDLQMTKSYGMVGFGAYAASKLANVFFTQELAQRLGGTQITVNAVHPGVVSTSIWPDSHWLWRFGDRILSRFRISAEEGARTVIYAAASESLEGITGKFLSDEQVREVKGNCRDVTLQ